MKLYRIKLRPRSPWRTPWQSDTLTGVLCATAARTRGADFLREHLIEPMLAGRPPFVLSDAFPADLLPLPLFARLQHPPEGTIPKQLKRLRWIARADLLRLRANPSDVPWQHLAADGDVFCRETTRHNTLARDSDASLEEGGLFAREDILLYPRRPAGGSPRQTASTAAPGPSPNPSLPDSDYLSLYARADDDALDLLLDLLYDLSLTGFGADTATGRGQFDLVGDAERDTVLDAPPPESAGVIILSTFHPAPGDPTDGLWETFPKFGKLGPDFGLSDVDVRKNTLIMFRPGACFRTDPATPFLGRALPMDLVLPPPTAARLTDRGVNVIHPAFGLAIPGKVSSYV